LADRVVVLDRGRIVADASPDDLRRRVAVPTIRCPLPTTAPVGELPPAFTHHLDQGNRLELPSTDPVHDLGILLRWAEAHHVDLSGLQVGPASLEDAYLTLTGADAAMLQDVAG
jgi:ABC-2 type transport system ATP-binding protein